MTHGDDIFYYDFNSTKQIVARNCKRILVWSIVGSVCYSVKSYRALREGEGILDHFELRKYLMKICEYTAK